MTAETETGAFAAGAVEQVAGDGDTELVGVAGEAVAAAEPAFAKQLREAEIQLGRIEQGQHALIAILPVQVEQPRLQGLHAACALSPAFEDQSAVDAVARHVQARVGGTGERLSFESIAQMFVTRRDAQERAGSFQRPVQPRRKIEAAARGQGAVVDVAPGNQAFLQLAVETSRLTRQAETEIRPEIEPGAKSEMRQAVIGLGDIEGVDQRVDDLDALRVQLGPQDIGREAQPRLPVQMIARGGIEPAAGKIDKPVPVADRGEIHQGAPVVAEPAVVLKAGEPAIFGRRRSGSGDGGERGVEPPVIAQPRQVRGIHRPCGEIAEFGAEHDAAVADQARHDGGVVMGRQIQVPGQFEIESAAAGRAHARRQQARDPPVAKREAQFEGIAEYGRIAEPQAQVARCAAAARGVERHGLGGDGPERVDRFAAAEFAVVHRDAARIAVMDDGRGAAVDAGLVQYVAGRENPAQIVSVVDESRISAQQHAGLAEFDIAFEREGVRGVVDDRGAVVGDPARALRYLDLAVDADRAGARAGESFGRGESGPAAVLVRRSATIDEGAAASRRESGALRGGHGFRRHPVETLDFRLRARLLSGGGRLPAQGQQRDGRQYSGSGFNSLHGRSIFLTAEPGAAGPGKGIIMERSPNARQGEAEQTRAADDRRAGLTAWTRARLRQLLPDAPELGELERVSGDASHRRYFRARPAAGISLIAVDAPPEREDSRRFVEVCRLLRAASLRAPELHAADIERGYMLLEDFGDQLYLPHLLRAQQEGDRETADRLCRAAVDSLLDLQQHVDARGLPAYDKTELTREMLLFPEWFCRRWLRVEPDAEQSGIIGDCCDFLCEAALAQTRVAVHRDYHSRNLMVPEAGADRPGILDFQDATRGACSYDLVSLLRDCYIKWDRRRLEYWIDYYLEGARARRIVGAISGARFRRDFDLMGLQRHLKVLGIFCRLAIRDRKPGFLADIPLVITYFTEVAREYREMEPLLSWFSRELEPRARDKLRAAR